MHNPVVIRPFMARDQVPARNLILEGMGQHWGFIDERLNPDIDDIEGNYLDNDYPFVVAEAANQLIGTGGLIVENETSAQMVRISIHQAYRRQGIGTQLVRHLLAIARQRHIHRVWMETVTCWQDAIGLYVHCGFAVFKTDDLCTYLEYLDETTAPQADS